MPGFKDLELTQEEKNEFLEEVLTKEHFLGHYAYEYTNDRYNPDLYQKLFNWHPEQFHEDEGVRPSIILGRRGSGKSSYLNNLAHKENVIAVAVKSWDAVDIVEDQINEILKRKASIDAEKVADIWHLIFLTLATRELAKHDVQDKGFKEFVKDFPIENVAKISLLTLVSDVMRIFKQKFLDSNSSTFNTTIIFQSMGIGCESLSSWERILSDAAKKIGKYIIVMMDNPEKLDGDDKSMMECWEDAYAESTRARWHAYSGLLTLLAHFNQGKVGIQIRYCVPAEQYFYLQERSSAILKDFANIQLLHWSSGDLLSSVAHRYMVCLQLHERNRDQRTYEKLKAIDIYTRDGAFRFFNEIFDGKVINSRGFEENPVEYLIRHTQLLPRQILIYINSAIQFALNDNREVDLSKLKASYLREAVEKHEGLLAAEIVDSYKSVFPEGRDLLKRIINFPIVSTCKDIQNNWKKYDAKKIQDSYKIFPQVSSGADRFLDFLTETGVVGVAENYKTHDKYINVEFEYTLPSHLKLQPSDILAVHPIFSGFTSVHSHSSLDSHAGIYPKGTGINDEQDKIMIRNKYIRCA